MSEKKCTIVFIKEDFFQKNNHFREMLDSSNRGKQIKRKYIFLNIQYKNNNLFIPLRSNIPSNRKLGDIGYPVPSQEKSNAGLDFRKILIVNDSIYIDEPKIPKIPKSQQKIIEQNYKTIENKVIQYIDGYIKSVLKKRQNRDKKYKFSTLHNFHNELGIIRLLLQKKELDQQVALTMD